MTEVEMPAPHANRAVDFFHSSADDYATKHYQKAARSFMTARQRRVLEFVDALELPAGSTVLDAGCGPGYLVEALAARGFRVSALDAADAMLDLARRRLEAAAPGQPVTFERGDIENLPFAPASFDLVLSTGVIEYLEDDERVLTEFRRALRPGGHLILPVTNSLSPANWFDFIIEPLKRQRWLLAPFNALWTRLGRTPILPRDFPVRRHSPAAFRASLASAGFDLRDEIYFHMLPWPRPLDQFVPSLTASIGERMEARARSWIGPLGEGFLTCSRLTER